MTSAIIGRCTFTIFPHFSLSKEVGSLENIISSEFLTQRTQRAQRYEISKSQSSFVFFAALRLNHIALYSPVSFILPSFFISSIFPESLMARHTFLGKLPMPIVLD
jgi:hypothetical protein